MRRRDDLLAARLDLPDQTAQVAQRVVERGRQPPEQVVGVTSGRSLHRQVAARRLCQGRRQLGDRPA